MNRLLICGLLLLAISSNAMAETRYEVPFGEKGTLEIIEHDAIINELTHDDIRLRMETLREEQEQSQNWDYASLSDIALEVVRVGEVLWKLVEKGKAVVNHQFKSASAIPRAAANWADLENWQTKTKYYTFKAKNWVNMTTVSFKYGVNFDYAGQLEGKGSYLANVSTYVKDLYVMPTYKFTARAEVMSVANKGASSNPVAQVKLKVSWIVNTLGQHSEKSDLYVIDGKGRIARY